MWCLGTWFSGGLGSVRLTVGLDDLKVWQSSCLTAEHTGGAAGASQLEPRLPQHRQDLADRSQARGV
ncbi:hypothetical protein QYF61_026782 [Mycteria americana]|uniref:Uncharacterized protein n=1 Tax=Mycteria americana TaxID=33587 RepID=A0AAN7SG62_MYCAM|nr:hypothetical protein QYF61_026782 [Mycteria americana]